MLALPITEGNIEQKGEKVWPGLKSFPLRKLKEI